MYLLTVQVPNASMVLVCVLTTPALGSLEPGINHRHIHPLMMYCFQYFRFPPFS